jgi:hypothetical protein
MDGETFWRPAAYYIVMGRKNKKCHMNEGGIMRILLTILLLLGVSVAQILPDEVEYEGLMPAVEVIAERYGSDLPAYVGSMPEVTVTATRYEYEDVAWSGLMPEVLVIATRPSVDIFAYSRIKDSSIKLNIIPSMIVR